MIEVTREMMQKYYDDLKNSFQEYYQRDFCMKKEAENSSLNKGNLKIDFIKVLHEVHTNQPDNYGVYYREKARVWWNRTYDRITEVWDGMSEELEKLFQEYIIKEECMLVDRMTFGDDVVSTVIASDELIKRENVNSAPKNHEQEGKNKMSLLPLDLLSELLCPAYEEGLLKYERESWRKGFKASVMADALLRHFSKFYYEREEFDEETMDKYHIQKRHLGACLFCIIAMYNSINIDSKSFDDRPNKGNNK